VYTRGVDEITANDGRRILIRQLSASDDLGIPFGGETFVSMIWAADGTAGETDRTTVVRTLIDTGCRYIVCGGVNCEQWHDDADLVWVNLDLQSDPSRSEMPFVMTTWHNGESVDEVAVFAADCTNFDEHDFRSYVVLIVGEDSARLACADQVCRAIHRAFGVQL
jgi:hypothetical protein